MLSLKEKFSKFVRYVKNHYRLHQYFRAAKKKQVNAHWDGKLVGFKYSRETTYSSNWNKITLAARGVTFDSVTGEIVARPFRKFFNFGELVTVEGVNTTLCKKLPKEYLPNLNGHFRVMDKLDGFLAITFFNPYTQKWQIKTSGSFHADQSDWAQAWFNEHIGSVGNSYDVIRNDSKDSSKLETTKSYYMIIEGEYGSREYTSDVSFQFIKVPYNIDKELEDEHLNIEKENYRSELKEGKYRDMTKIKDNFRKLGINADLI